MKPYGVKKDQNAWEEFVRKGLYFGRVSGSKAMRFMARAAKKAHRCAVKTSLRKEEE